MLELLIPVGFDFMLQSTLQQLSTLVFVKCRECVSEGVYAPVCTCMVARCRQALKIAIIGRHMPGAVFLHALSIGMYRHGPCCMCIRQAWFTTIRV